MSNALPLPLPLPLQTLLAATATTSRPAVQEIGVLSPMMTTLCGVGMCIFVIWSGHGVINPAKFKLSTSPGRPNRLTPLHILALLVVSMLGGGLLAGAVGLCLKLGETQRIITAAMTIPLLAMFGGVIVAAFSFDGGAVRGMGFTARRWLNDSIRSVIGFLAILPVCFFLLIATTWLILQWDPNTNLLAPHAYLQILIDSDVPMVWRTLLVLAAVVLAPLGEEIFFRGLLQSMFRRYLQQPWVAILLTSMLFSAVHFTDIKSLPALFALSMALGYNYERTGRLYSPIMIHMLFNMVNIAEMFTNTAI